MDEKSGMNFSEYVAILSGNTDLLDKAKLEKQIAGLESEKQAFNRSKSVPNLRCKIIGNVAKHSIPFEPDEYRLGKLTATLQKRSDGTIENPVLLLACRPMQIRNKSVQN
jgi:hypothetical protein